MSAVLRRASLALAGLAALALALSSAPARAGETDTRAAELVKRAVELYRAGTNLEAAQLFLEAFELSHRPAQLRNAAKAFEGAGRIEEALVLWERYRGLAGVGRDELAEAEARIEAIREKRKNAEALVAVGAAQAAAEAARLEAEKARAEAVEARAEAARANAGAANASLAASAPASSGRSRVWPVVTTAGGGALIATGVVLWLVQSSQLSDLDAHLADEEGGRIIGITPAEAERQLSTINSERVAAGVLAVVGVVAAGGGAAWLIFGTGSGSEAAAAGAPISASPPSVGFTVGGAQLQWGGRW